MWDVYAGPVAEYSVQESQETSEHIPSSAQETAQETSGRHRHYLYIPHRCPEGLKEQLAADDASAVSILLTSLFAVTDVPNAFNSFSVLFRLESDCLQATANGKNANEPHLTTPFPAATSATDAQAVESIATLPHSSGSADCEVVLYGKREIKRVFFKQGAVMVDFSILCFTVCYFYNHIS